MGTSGSLSGVAVALISALFQARLQRDDATHISIQPYAGGYVEVAGEAVNVTGGFTRSQADNRIDATGADAGAALAVNTLYYVYVSNSQASFSPLSIRCSTVAPTAVNGVKYLGNAGSALNWRFVGWVRTISNGGTPNFADSLTQRFVVNYYNRLKTFLFSCPGYTNDNAQTTYNEANAVNWHEIHAGVGSKVEYIANGEDAARIYMQVWESLNVFATDDMSIGVGRSSATSPTVSSGPIGFTSTEDLSLLENVEDIYIPAEGYQYADMLVSVSAGAGGIDIVADAARNGAAADPAVSYIEAEIMA